MIVHVFLHDEIPSLGCGWRTFTVHETDKWVHLTDVMGRTARLTPQAWAAIYKEEKS